MPPKKRGKKRSEKFTRVKKRTQKSKATYELYKKTRVEVMNGKTFEPPASEISDADEFQLHVETELIIPDTCLEVGEEEIELPLATVDPLVFKVLPATSPRLEMVPVCANVVPPSNYGHQLHQNIKEKVLSQLEEQLPFPWICLPEERGIHVVLISRLKEKAIQRRVFFPFDRGVEEEVTVHRKPVPKFIENHILLKDDILSERPGFSEEGHEGFIKHILSVIDRFRCYEICSGVSEAEFKDMWYTEEDGEIDKNWFGELRYNESFRPSVCDLLVPTMPILKRRCGVCVQQSTKFRLRYEKDYPEMDKSAEILMKYDRVKLVKKVQKLQFELNQAQSQVVMLIKETEELNGKTNKISKTMP